MQTSYKQNNKQNFPYSNSVLRSNVQRYKMDNRQLHKAVCSLSKEELDVFRGQGTRTPVEGSAPLYPADLELYREKVCSMTDNEFKAWLDRETSKADTGSAPGYPSHLY